MTDVVDKETRSQMMAGIMGKNTKPDILVRRSLLAAGLRFMLHDLRLPKSPDLVFAGLKVAPFVHGWFWHHHADCPFTATPRNRADFWQQKFSDKVARDRRNLNAPVTSEWRQIVAWECALAQDSALDELYWRVRATTHSPA